MYVHTTPSSYIRRGFLFYFNASSRNPSIIYLGGENDVRIQARNVITSRWPTT